LSFHDVIPRAVAESTPRDSIDRQRGSCDCAQDDIALESCLQPMGTSTASCCAGNFSHATSLR
jgi:hypothetical protein